MGRIPSMVQTPDAPPGPRYFFPCPVCQELRPVRQTKNRKPYLRCDPCGVQLFVRGEDGIELFRKAVRTADGKIGAAEPQAREEAEKVRRGRPRKPQEVRESVDRAVEKVVGERPPLGPLSVTGNRR